MTLSRTVAVLALASAFAGTAPASATASAPASATASATAPAPAPASAAAATPVPKHEQLSAGGLDVTLDYRLESPYLATNVQLSITRAGQALVSGDDLGAACPLCRGAVPVGGLDGSGAKSLTIRDIAADGEPQVLVDLYSGGAHCCSITVFYRYDPATGRYGRIVHDWGDPGYAIQTTPGGQTVLKTYDDRFADSFCAFVCSLMPVQVFALRDDGLDDITRSLPGYTRTDLAHLTATLASARRRRSQHFAIKGILPAICADDRLLGMAGDCNALLADAARRGELAPTPARYERRLRRFLGRLGY